MLILAATPIGNLEDASPRLKRVLEEADHVYAEDTRQSGKLLKHLEVSRRLSSFHEHSGPGVLKHIGNQLEGGETVAYISDAGMPGISDPGYELVRTARELDVEVDVIPGPSAVINALVLSGLPNHGFCFMGFFPPKAEQRRLLVSRLELLDMTSIFFEGPSRIEQALAFLAETIPQTPIAVCREMTKLHQEVLRGTPSQVLGRLEMARGEFVLVIGPVIKAIDERDPKIRYHELLEKGMTPTNAVKMLARELRLPKREIYKMVIQ